MERLSVRFDHELSSNGLCGGGEVALLHGTGLFEEAISLVVALWDQLLPRWIFPKDIYPSQRPLLSCFPGPYANGPTLEYHKAIVLQRRYLAKKL